MELFGALDYVYYRINRRNDDPLHFKHFNEKNTLSGIG